jgi:flagellar hook-length control protein FliK
MNNFPTVNPISAAFDSAPKPATQTETATSSPDDFSSMLASMWCGPAVVQPTTPEASAAPDTTDSSVCVVTDELVPSSSVSTSEEVISEIATETGTPISEQVTQKLPARPPLVSEEPLPPVESGLETDTIESIPVVVYQTPDEAPKSGSTLPTMTETPVAPDVARQVSRDFVRPINPEGYPDGVKTVTPIRRTPTFNIDLPGAPKQPADSQVAAVAAEKVVPANVAKVPNGATVITDSNVAGAGPVAAKSQPTDEVTAEAIRREANLVASYLAQSTRDSRENSLESIKTQVSGSGPEGKSNETGSEPTSADSKSQVDLTSPTFATSLKRQIADRAAEVVGPQVTREIIELADATPQRQTRSVRLRLRPEELGQVEVQLTRDAAGKVSAQMVVERESSRAALAQSLPQLRETLERAGLTVDRLQVSSETSSFAGNARDTYRQSNDETLGTTNAQAESITATETPNRVRVRDHKLLSLSA